MGDLIIGIDVGVNTGVAVWCVPSKRFEGIFCMSILKAFVCVKEYRERISMVYVEDPRQVRHNTDRKKSQGAGSVKRDAQIWEEFLKMYNIPHTFVRPSKSITKIKRDRFEKITGYKGRSNEHSRDAAMLVYGRTK